MVSRRVARRNRIGLAIVGAVLLVVGVAALVRGLGWWRSGLGAADAPLGGAGTRSMTIDQGWFWPVVAVGLVVIALLALAWLISQAGSGGPRQLRVESDPRRGTTTIPARVATGALEDDLLDSPHFQQAQATLRGSATRPRLQLRATVPVTADLPAARQRLREALRRHRQALESTPNTTAVLLRSR